MASNTCLTVILAATIMGAASGFVNANPAVLTEKKSSQKGAKPRALTLTELVHRMLTVAVDDELVPDQAEVHHLTPFAPIKLLSAKSNDREWTNKWCDLVLGSGSDKRGPRCLVLIVRQRNGVVVSFKSYRLDLKGRLESAYLFTGRLDEKGKPIRGSSAGQALDASSKSIQKDANDELAFWLAGRADGSK